MSIRLQAAQRPIQVPLPQVEDIEWVETKSSSSRRSVVDVVRRLLALLAALQEEIGLDLKVMVDVEEHARRNHDEREPFLKRGLCHAFRVFALRRRRRGCNGELHGYCR